MKKILTCLLLLSQYIVFAGVYPSNGDYTYRKDMKIANIYQLSNQVFVPQEVIEGKTTETAEAGKVRILVGSDMVSFKGVAGLTAFGIVSKLKTIYGYELKLLDSRGSDFSTLAIETDSENYVEKLYFDSKRYGNFEFRLPQKSSEQEQAEKKYFTAKGTHKIYTYKDLNGKTLTPYQRINLTNTTRGEEKISMVENFGINFDAKKMTVKTGNHAQILKVRKTTLGLDKVNGKQVKVLRIKTNKRSQNMAIYLNDNNQIETIKSGNLQYAFM